MISLIVIWVKLTQGTGRGTCWWSIFIYDFLFFSMFELLFSGKFDAQAYSVLEDVFVVLMLYSFLKLILLSSLIELIWPTQFFNKRNSMGVTIYRFRTYVETVLKLRSIKVTLPQLTISINFR